MKNRIQTHLPSIHSFKSWLQFPALVMSATLPWLSPAFGDTVTFNTAGTTNWVCPPGVTSIQVECWGGGGAGGAANNTSTASSGTINVAGGGGAGGAYARKTSVPVTPGLSYTITIPAAATRAAGSAEGTRTDGGTVTFTGDAGVLVTAVGGQGGASKVASTTSTGASGVGSTTGCVGDVLFAGGSCTVGISSGNAGGGGGGAGDANNGGNTGNNVGGAGGVAGGGAGGTGPTGSNAGGAGTTPGGGGSGARMQRLNGSARAGGTGGRGQIVLTYTVPANYKANNADNLNLASSWTLGVPTGTLAVWQNTVTGPNTTSLGADLTFSGIQVLDPGGLVTINSGNTLTLGAAATDIDLSLATQDLTLNCDLAMNAANVWDVDASRTLTLGGTVSGAFGVTKQGSGTAILQGANTWTGNTAVTSGSLKLGATSVIPDGTGNGNLTVDGTLDLNGYNEAINGLSGIGFVDNTAASTVSTITAGANNATGIFSGILQNTGSAASLRLTKTGTGTLTLSGTNTHAGTTTVSGGALNIQNSSALGTTAGGTEVNGTSTGGTSNARLELQGDITVSGEAINIKGVGNFIGALASFSGNNEWTGNVTLGAAGARIGASAGASLKVSGVIDSGANNYGPVIRTTDLTGTVILSGANTYLGDTQVLIGKLQLAGADNRLPVGTKLILSSSSTNPDAEFDLNGINQEVAGLSMTGTASKNKITNSSGTLSTLTVNTAAAPPSSFAGIIAGNLALTKTGAETLTLAGANTYTGATNVNGGTLFFSTDGSGASSVTVGNAAAAGALVAAVDAQFVSTGDLSMNNSSILAIDYGSTTPSSTVAPIKVANFNVGTGLSLLIKGGNLSGLTPSQSYPLVTWTTSGPADASAFTAVLNQRIQGTFSVTGNTLYLNVTFNNAGSPISWNTGNGTWDTTTSNWVDAALAATTFIDTEDAVLFGDAAGASGNPLITLNSTLSPSSVTVNSASHDYTISGTGAIGGNASLTLHAANTRTLTLTTANTYTGATSINGGTLRLGDGGTTGSLATTGAISVGTGATFAVNRSDTVTQGTDFSTAAISGAGGFSQTGSGTTILNAANTFSGPVTIAGGILRIGGTGQLGGGTYAGDISISTGTSLQFASTAAQTLSGIISGNGSLSKNAGSATLTLSGANTYTGSTAINGGTVNLASSSALNLTSGVTMADGTTLRPSIVGPVATSAPITISGNVTIGAPTVAIGTQAWNEFVLNGAIGGTGNVTFVNTNNINQIFTVTLGAAGTYSGTTLIDNTAGTAGQIFVRLGANDALPTTTIVTIDGQEGAGTGRGAEINLNGFNQTLAGLTNVTRSLRVQRVVNSNVSTAATLTINGSTNTTFSGNLGTNSSNFSVSASTIPGSANGGNFGLTKNGSGTFTLAASNPYYGATKILGGILSLANATAMNQSPLDTANSIAGDATNGLQTTVTTLTLGGLTGDKNFADLFETTAGGYSGVTALTLNPRTGATPTYSGIIADGAAGMTLTKSGAGTQTLAGSNTYTGATNINAGTLALGAGNVIPNGSPVSIGNATLDAATFTDTAGALDVTGTATINLGTGAALAFADSSGIDWTDGALAITGSFVSGSSLRFGASASGLTLAQIGQISISGFTSPALDANGYLTATPVVTGAPEIAVEQPAATDIPNNGAQAFGSVTLGSNSSLTFTIRNSGTDALNLTGSPLVAVGGTNASDFTVTAQPTTPVTSGGGTTTFTVQFAPSAAGARSASLTITNNDGDEGTFIINVSGTGQTQYDAWSGGAAFDADANGDGVENGLAFLLGAASPGANALALLPTVSQSGGNLVLTFQCLNAASRGAATMSVEHSSNLGISDPWTAVPVPDTTPGSPTSGVTFSVTPGSPTNGVTATISNSEAAAGKLFGRLKGQP